MTQVFGQLDNRQERNQDYQNWLSCSRVLPNGDLEPPVARVDVAATITIVREALQSSPMLTIDVSGDSDAVARIRSGLTDAENTRVEFSLL